MPQRAPRGAPTPGQGVGPSRFEAPVPTPCDETVWLQPFPDAFIWGAVERPLGPEARYEQSEAISLAFAADLQVLPPRQLAVLILRGLLGFHPSEVAARASDDRSARVLGELTLGRDRLGRRS